jgi:hypothetical protein
MAKFRVGRTLAIGRFGRSSTVTCCPHAEVPAFDVVRHRRLATALPGGETPPRAASPLGGRSEDADD